jgi:hypothetical protein
MSANMPANLKFFHNRTEKRFQIFALGRLTMFLLRKLSLVCLQKRPLTEIFRRKKPFTFFLVTSLSVAAGRS